MMKKLILIVLALLLTVSAVSAGTVMVTPSEPETTDDLTGYVSGVASDVEFDYYWMKDGQVYETCSDTTCTLDASYTSVGDVWTVHAFVPESAWVDTYEYGLASVTIRESEEEETPDVIPLGTSELSATDIHFTVTEGDLVDVDLEEVNYFQYQTYKILTMLAESTNVYAYDNDGDSLKISYFGYLDGEGRWQTEDGDAGHYFTTATVSDGHGHSAQVTVSITVLDNGVVENTCPDITAYDTTVEEGGVAVALYTANDADEDSLTYSFSTPFDENGEWQTEVGDEGTYMAYVTVSDGTCEASDDFLVTVTCLDADNDGACDDEETEENTSPEVTASDLTVEEGELAVADYQAYDADGDALTVSFSSPFDSNGQWQTAEGDKGVYTAYVTVSDGEYSASDYFTLTVTCSDANDNDVCDDQETTDDDDNTDDEEVTESNYEGDLLSVITLQALNAGHLYSAYDVSDLNVETSGVFYVEDGYLRSSASDNFVKVLLTIENENSFDANDIDVVFILEGKSYRSSFEDLDRSEKASQVYTIALPENLESGSYPLTVIVSSDDISYENVINLNVNSLGDYVVDGTVETHESFWDWLKGLFNKLF